MNQERKPLRLWIVLAALVIAVLIPFYGLGAQGFNAFQQTTFTTVTTAQPLVENTVIGFNQLSWTVSGTVATCTVALDSSADNVSYTPGGVIVGQTCTSNGNSSVTAGSANFMRVNVTALSGAGATVVVTYKGWVQNPAGGGGSGTVTNTGGALTSNAVVLGAGGNDTKVSTGIVTNGASELDVGIAGGATGVVGLNGSTSGKITATANATATVATWNGALNATQFQTGPGADGAVGIYTTTNNAAWRPSFISELITLSTSGTTTDSAANLLPANSIIEAVVARVTTTITTATDWALGDATIATRFSSANSTLTAGTTQIGLNAVDQTGTSGPKQIAAAKLRITTTGTPGAGVIRVTVFYRAFIAPTS